MNTSEQLDTINDETLTAIAGGTWRPIERRWTDCFPQNDCPPGTDCPPGAPSTVTNNGGCGVPQLNRNLEGRGGFPIGINPHAPKYGLDLTTSNNNS